MDLLCRMCKEPWDNDSLHDEAEVSGKTYDEVFKEFKLKGCSALSEGFDGTCNESAVEGGVPVLNEIYGAVGSDSDFAASMIDDAHAMGMI